MSEIVARRQRNAVPFGSLPQMKRAADEKMPPMICRAVFEEMFILASGDIVCASPDPNGRRIYGNVNEDKIADVFNGKMYQEMRGWQLDSQPDSWCPVTVENCSRRVSRPTRLDGLNDCRVTNVEIEPISACNVKCPECPVTLDFRSPSLADRARKLLSLDTMNDIVRQLPDLQKIRLYGFGEPFLHKDLVEFLRTTKNLRPEVHIGISTNGIPLNDTKITAIAREGLVDTIVFAIDGVDQESYSRYRVGGDVRKALANMTKMAQAVAAAGTNDKVEVVWQYILFEWNDSEDELRRAIQIADSLNVRIHWLATHSNGSSKRYLSGSPELASLQGSTPSSSGGTAEVKLKDMLKNSSTSATVYLASIEANKSRLVAGQNGSIGLDLTIKNLGQTDWDCADESSLFQKGKIRIGVLAQDKTGKTINEIWAGVLPSVNFQSGATAAVHVLAPVSLLPGEYRILVDLVDEFRCWFHEKGSAPLILELLVVAAAVPEISSKKGSQTSGASNYVLQCPVRDPSNANADRLSVRRNMSLLTVITMTFCAAALLGMSVELEIFPGGILEDANIGPVPLWGACLALLLLILAVAIGTVLIMIEDRQRS